MKAKVTNEFKRRTQLTIAQSKVARQGHYQAVISEGKNWWFCQCWFNKATGKSIEQPQEGDSITSEIKLVMCKGATPIKAARNFLKLLPRRVPNARPNPID